MAAQILPFSRPQNTVEGAREICETPLNRELSGAMRCMVRAAEAVAAAMLFEKEDRATAHMHLSTAKSLMYDIETYLEDARI